MSGDRVSAIVARAIDILFVQNPRGTSFGAVCGVAANGVAKVFSDVSTRLGSAGILYFIAAGIAVANVPAMASTRRELPIEFEEALEVIRRSEGQLTAAQIRMQYLALITEAAARTKRSSGTPPATAS